MSSLRAIPARKPVAPRRRLRALLAITALFLATFTVTLTVAAPASARVPARTTFENTVSWVIKNVINYQRAYNGLRPLRMNGDLRLSARRHNYRMALHNELSHELDGEASFTDRMSYAGYNWSYAGENIAWNSDISRAGVVLLQRLMYREKPPQDGHRRNILNPAFRDVGVDVLVDRVHHKVWLTTDFGRP